MSPALPHSGSTRWLPCSLPAGRGTRLLAAVTRAGGSMEETRTVEAPDQRDRHVIRRTAELLASDVPLRDVFSQFCRLLSSVIDASRVFIALHEKTSLRIVYMLADGN